MRKKAVSVWSNELARLITKLWKEEKLTASQIAKRLQGKGFHFSRNAVLSKLHREGVLGGQKPHIDRSALSAAPKKRQPITTVVGAQQSDAAKRRQSAALFGGRKPREVKEEQNNLDVIRASVPHAGVHPPNAEHLTLCALSDKEEAAKASGVAAWRRCRWPTSPFSARETTYCGVSLDESQKEAYCEVHEYRRQQKPVLSDEGRAKLIEILGLKKESSTAVITESS